MIAKLGLAVAPLALLAACSSGSPVDLSSTVPNPTMPNPSASSAGGSSAGGSGGGESSSGSSAGASSGESSAAPSGEASPSEVLAVLCDKATPEEAAAIKAVLKPDYKATQIVDVRTDDDGDHAILAFVEGPGLAVLATWTGTGLKLDNLASADEFAAQASTAPQVTASGDVAKYLGETSKCYTTLFAPKN